MQHIDADIRVIKNTVGEFGAMTSRQSSSLKNVLLTFSWIMWGQVKRSKSCVGVPVARGVHEAERQAVQFEGKCVRTGGKDLKRPFLLFYPWRTPFCHSCTVLWRVFRLDKAYLLERIPRACSLESVHVFHLVLGRTSFIKQLIRQCSGNNALLLEGSVTTYKG